jgi:2-keto-3-deoxy-6-phosphogluconate aldolase
VAVGAGGELASAKLAQEGRWEAITERARAFAEVVRSARG